MKEKLKWGLHPSFIILAIFYFYFEIYLEFLITLLTLILHEFCHAFVAKKMGYEINKIFLLPFGAQLSLKQNFQTAKDEIIVAIAGPLLNFCLAIIFIAFWWLFPEIYNYSFQFVNANLSLALINLLPCFPLDGGRIFNALLSLKFKRKICNKICLIINLCFSLILCLAFIVTIKNFNPTIMLMAIFIFIGGFDDKFAGNYNILILPFNNNKKEIRQVNLISVQPSTKIFKVFSKFKKNKYNFVIIQFKNKPKILTEEKFFELSIKLNPTKSFEEIF